MQYYSLLFAARGRLLLVVPDGKKKMLADLTLTQESFQRSWGEGCSYRTIAMHPTLQALVYSICDAKRGCYIAGDCINTS